MSGETTSLSAPVVWEHQLQLRLEVDSELRCGQSEPGSPSHGDWLGVAHLSTNENPGKAFL